MAEYSIRFTETRDAHLVIEADTEEHARVKALAEIRPYDFEFSSGYNRHITGVERLWLDGWEKQHGTD